MDPTYEETIGVTNCINLRSIILVDNNKQTIAWSRCGFLQNTKTKSKINIIRNSWKGQVNCLRQRSQYLVVFRLANNVKISWIHLCIKAMLSVQMDWQSSKPGIHCEPSRNTYLKKQRKKNKHQPELTNSYNYDIFHNK